MGHGVEKKTEKAKNLKCKRQMVSAFSFAQIGTMSTGTKIRWGVGRGNVISFQWSNLDPNPLHIKPF